MYNPQANLPPLGASTELISRATGLRLDYFAVAICATVLAEWLYMDISFLQLPSHMWSPPEKPHLA